MFASLLGKCKLKPQLSTATLLSRSQNSETGDNIRIWQEFWEDSYLCWQQKWYNSLGKFRPSLKILNHHTDQQLYFWAYIPGKKKKKNQCLQPNLCRVFIAALFIIAPNPKEPTHSAVSSLANYETSLLSNKEEWDIDTNNILWVNIQRIMLRERPISNYFIVYDYLLNSIKMAKL